MRRNRTDARRGAPASRPPMSSLPPGPGNARPPQFGPPLADDKRRTSPGDELWQIAVYLPAGRAADVARLLREQGVEVYRMWQPS